MVSTGHAKQDLPYVILAALRRVLPALISALALRASALAYGVEWDERYLVVLIIASLLAIILLTGKSRDSEVVPPSIVQTSLSVAGRWYVRLIRMLAVNDGEADYESNWATLTFEIGD